MYLLLSLSKSKAFSSISFRYARDVCEVVEEESKKSYKALLYRGTPENPAFSSRALLDLPFSAAIMSVSVGPSGCVHFVHIVTRSIVISMVLVIFTFFRYHGRSIPIKKH